MITMGIDASTTCTGWSVFKDNKLLECGKIIPIDPKADWRERLISISKDLSKIVDKYKPKKVFVEDVPLMSKGGMKTLVILGAVQGSLIGLFHSRNIDIDFIPVSKWRQELSLFNGTKKGKERDELKQASINYANKKFNLDLKWVSPSSKKNDDDIADAINICWSQIKPKNRGFNKGV